LTSAQIVPHLTHRPIVQFELNHFKTVALHNNFDYVLLDTRHPGMSCSKECLTTLLGQFQQSATYQLAYQRDDVYLFVQPVVKKPV
jgi:hypothetical protein